MIEPQPDAFERTLGCFLFAPSLPTLNRSRPVWQRQPRTPRGRRNANGEGSAMSEMPVDCLMVAKAYRSRPEVDPRGFW